GIISILILLLLIPTHYVKNLIEEREARQKDAIAEVSQKWAGKQTITGPILGIPYITTTADVNGKVTNTKNYAYFLPDQLHVSAVANPQEKYRGIYKVMLYNAQVNMQGQFAKVNLSQLGIEPQSIVWDEVFVRMSIADTRGLNEELQLKWKDTILKFAPNTIGEQDGAGGLTARLPIQSAEELDNISFSSKLNVSGAEQLLFTPIGKTSKIDIESAYPHPSFTGEVLPQSTLIKDSGFKASWTSLAHKRSFPQEFRQNESPNGKTYNVENAAVGVSLFVPVNSYQKTLRSIKYAILCIALTFAAFFLIETINRKSVHPFQYGLIGLALVLFYTLLLSFSEYIGFNPAYGVAALCTVGLIAWFVKGILLSGKLSTILSIVLLLVYSYVFSILQLQDYSLLLGSMGLFLTLAVIMYFSRKLQW
ncbi:MAG TPA: cell envelope integrity protein CreD, partial [Flavisolibacter sp.]|nr:cell envelope integrity protein CreD [Flavisolibacter sp.]